MGWGGGREFKNNYLTEMCSGSDAGSYLRLILLYHSTLGLRVIKKRREKRREPESIIWVTERPRLSAAACHSKLPKCRGVS